MSPISPKTMAWLAASNLLLAVFMAFDGSHYLAMLNFFCGGFTLSGAIDAHQWNRMIKLVDEIMSLFESRRENTSPASPSSSVGADGAQLEAGEVGKE